MEMWICRRLENVKWEQKISNEAVLTMVNETRGLIRKIRERQKNWIGHVLRGDGLLRDVLEGRMLKNRQRGGQRTKMLDGLMEGSFEKMKRRAEDREEWRRWVPRTCLTAEHWWWWWWWYNNFPALLFIGRLLVFLNPVGSPNNSV
jgi:hypothetical protein